MGAVPADVSGYRQSTFEDRLKDVLTRTMAKVGPETKTHLQALLSPDTLKIIAGVLVAWIVAHAFGLGEIIDVILVATGAIAIGWAIFEGPRPSRSWASRSCSRSCSAAPRTPARAG
jgi:hypothetical protein